MPVIPRPLDLRTDEPPARRALRRSPAWTIALFIALLSLTPRRAAALEDLFAPRSLGTGEALRADAVGSLGPMLNPSGMALTKTYALDAFYGFDVRTTGSQVHLSIVDSQTSRLATGVYYNYLSASPKLGVLGYGPLNVSHSGSETGLAFGVALGDYFTLGATLKYLHFSTEAANPFYDSVKNAGVPQTLTLDSTTSTATADGFTFDAGLTLRLGERFSLGVVGYNLIPLYSVDAPIALGTGIAVKATSTLTLAFDTVINFNKYRNIVDGDPNNLQRRTTVRLGGGLEWLAGSKVPIRLGAIYDSGRPGAYLTAGLGYTSTSFAIDLSYRQQISSGKESLLVLGLRVFLQ